MLPATLIALFACAQVANPVPNIGMLVIVGGGTIPNSIRDRFINLAGGDKANILVVPTASEHADEPAETDSYLSPWKKRTRGRVAILHTRDRAVADTAEFLKPVGEATAIWFAGGDQARITKAYLGTKAEAAFRAVLTRGGVIGGTSAGAAIMSDPMITGGTTVATHDRGFGFLPGVIADQHFVARKRLPRLAGMVEKHPGKIGLGIDEATAVVVTNDRLEVLGDSTATVLLSAGAGLPESEWVLKAGQTAELKPLRRDAERRKTP